MYGDVEYGEVSSLRQNQLAAANAAFDNSVKEYIDQVKVSVESLKKQVCDRMEQLDQYISRIYHHYMTELKHGEELKKKAEKNKENVEWLDRFVQKVDRLLDIGEAES